MKTFAEFTTYFSPAELEGYKSAFNSVGGRVCESWEGCMNNASRRYDSFSDFIDKTLHWAATPQGQDYWANFPKRRYAPYGVNFYAMKPDGSFVVIDNFNQVSGILEPQYTCDKPDSYSRVFVLREDRDKFKSVGREWFRDDYFWTCVPATDYFKIVTRSGYYKQPTINTMTRKQFEAEVFNDELILIPEGANEYDVNAYWENELSMNLSGYYFKDGKPTRCDSAGGEMRAVVMMKKRQYGENCHFFAFIDPATGLGGKPIVFLKHIYSYFANDMPISYAVLAEDLHNGLLDDQIVRDYEGQLIRADSAIEVHTLNGTITIDEDELDNLCNTYQTFSGREYYVNHVNADGEYYINTDVANEHDYYYCSDCEEWYNSNDEDHNHDDYEDEDSNNPRYEYHSCEHYDYSDGAEYKIGLEIEKECSDGCEHSHHEIRQKFGWAKERDGSLCDEYGYELVSPAYDLFGKRVLEDAKKIEEAFPMLINGRTSSNCGGHIHFSKRDTLGADLLESVCGYLPLLYSIYEHRINKSYCKVEEKEAMKNSDNKYQAVKVMRSRIEFRIFPAVKNLQVIEWRIELLRLMAKNPSSNPIQVAIDLANSKTKLHKHFAKIFKRETIYLKAKKALEYARQFDSNYYNVDMRANMRNINNKISRLNKADAKKAEAKKELV